MNWNKSTNITTLLAFSLLLVSYSKSIACGWSENMEAVRLALFRAEMEGAEAFRPFNYSSEIYNSYRPDGEEVDRKKNVLEWQQKLGKDVLLSDIDFILYRTSPEIYRVQLNAGNLGAYFQGNTYIERLLEDKNKPILDYLTFAKEIEDRSFSGLSKHWESWDNLYESAEKKGKTIDAYRYYIEEMLPSQADDFLRQRYAFLYLRMACYSGEHEEAIAYYDEYLADTPSPTIIQPWALLFKAMSLDGLDKTLEANYLYSLVFDQCEEKKLASIRRFPRKKEKADRALTLAKNDHQRAVILSMQSLRNPAPALDELRLIHRLAPDSRYFSVLVTREINKLEDWIFTPKYTEYGPSIYLSSEDSDWYYDYDKARAKNLLKDMAYLRKVNAYLKDVHQSAKGKKRDFLSLAIAHLAFIADDLKAGKQYIEQTSASLNPSMQKQKLMLKALVAIESEDLTKAETRQKLYTTLAYLEKEAKKDSEYSKELYSFLRVMSEAFERKGDRVSAGLLFMKSSYAKEMYAGSYWKPWEDWPYWSIAYFDRKATTKDIDKLLTLKDKRNKTPFETYLSEISWPPANMYKDLKVTIAFRNNDLELARQTLAEIPADFYENTYEYKHYLNEDPFFPKALVRTVKRDLNYPFSKKKFVEELIALKKQANTPRNAAAAYLKLGHAYFNVSYHGNSWMMTSYGWSVSKYKRAHEYLFGEMADLKKNWQEGNYFDCNIASDYYKKALEAAKDEETKAMASLMIYLCDYHAAQVADKERNIKEKWAIDDFNEKYRDTEVFRKHNCW